MIQAANNLLRFINDDRTRHGKKWADFESLPGKLRVLLKRVFPAGLTVSECQKCLKQIIIVRLSFQELKVKSMATFGVQS